MYNDMFRQMQKTLTQFTTWFDAADAHAKAKAFDPKVYLTLRLAPDQFPLARQVQIACDTSKLAASRLGAKEAPSHADTESTLDELRARVASVAAYLGTFTAKDFEGAATRVISQPRWEGKVMSGHDYLLEYVVPNFYFHAAHTYAILRHAGVHIGKKDYLGQLSMKTP